MGKQSWPSAAVAVAVAPVAAIIGARTTRWFDSRLSILCLGLTFDIRWRRVSAPVSTAVIPWRRTIATPRVVLGNMIKLIRQARIVGVFRSCALESLLATLAQLFLEQDDVLGVALICRICDISEEWHNPKQEVNDDVEFHLHLQPSVQGWLDRTDGAVDQQAEEHIEDIANTWNDTDDSAPPNLDAHELAESKVKAICTPFGFCECLCFLLRQTRRVSFGQLLLGLEAQSSRGDGFEVRILTFVRAMENTQRLNGTYLMALLVLLAFLEQLAQYEFRNNARHSDCGGIPTLMGNARPQSLSGTYSTEGG
jgi:hypothetical protein